MSSSNVANRGKEKGSSCGIEKKKSQFNIPTFLLLKNGEHTLKSCHFKDETFLPILKMDTKEFLDLNNNLEMSSANTLSYNEGFYERDWNELFELDKERTRQKFD